jgi:20S proteasome alpha/beta subunit
MNSLQHQGYIGGSGYESANHNANATTEYPGMKVDEVSTGTTIMAIPIHGGVILGADTRVTTGIYIVNRVSDKIAQISEHIFICRSGSAADCMALSDYCKFYLQQLEYV